MTNKNLQNVINEAHRYMKKLIFWLRGSNDYLYRNTNIQLYTSLLKNGYSIGVNEGYSIFHQIICVNIGGDLRKLGYYDEDFTFSIHSVNFPTEKWLNDDVKNLLSLVREIPTFSIFPIEIEDMIIQFYFEDII